MNGKKLYRSESNRMLCGVCAGIAGSFLRPEEVKKANADYCPGRDHRFRYYGSRT